MTLRAGEVIRGWLGWCPNGHAAKIQRDSLGGARSRAACRSADAPDAPGAGGAQVPPDSEYLHTQTGYLLLCLIGGACIFMLFMIIFLGGLLVLGIVIAIMIFLLSIMSTLTVSLDRQNLSIRFGPVGLIRKSWPIADIASAVPVTNPWYYGYGIHLTPRGILYNVSGNKAVEVLLLSGKTIRIGTDEPEELSLAISRHSRQAGRS